MDSGETGSRKSLVLASLLGECDILNGTVKAPKRPSIHDKGSSPLNEENWVLESAVAYVAQTPWMENTMIIKNILFGLPHDQRRYHEVLRACALDRDIDMLDDGDMTIVGANGVRVSGGQKSRISLARALYSRAGTLLLDDIFSAVDTSTGRHLYHNALTGRLSRNRTRILVTHRVALCKDQTKLLIIQEAGTVKYAGPTTKDTIALSRSPGLVGCEVNLSSEGHGRGEREVSEFRSRQTPSSRPRVLEEGQLNASPDIAHEEKRENGAVKLRIYLEYVRAGGSFEFWGFIVILYLVYMLLIMGRVSTDSQTSSVSRLSQLTLWACSVLVDELLDRVDIKQATI